MKVNAKVLWKNNWPKLKKAIQEPIYRFDQALLAKDLKITRDNLLIHSRYSGFLEYLRFGQQNHFIRTLALIRYLNSVSSKDRFTGVRLLIAKLKKQELNQEGVTLFLFLFFRLMRLITLEHESENFSEEEKIIAQLYELFYRPALASHLFSSYKRYLPRVGLEAYVSFEETEHSPVEVLLFLRIAQVKHLICSGTQKIMKEVYSVARVFNIDVSKVDHEKVLFSKRFSKNRKKPPSQKIYREHFIAQRNLLLKSDIFNAMHEVHSLEPSRFNWWFEKFEPWWIKVHYFWRSFFKLNFAYGIGLYLVGWTAGWLWIFFSFLESALADVLIKHPIKNILFKFQEVWGDVKKRKAIENIYYSGLSIIPLFFTQKYLIEQFIFSYLAPSTGVNLLLVNYFVISLANGMWSYFQRVVRQSFSRTVAKIDFLRGFGGYLVPALLSVFLSLSPVAYIVLGKIGKAMVSILAEWIPGISRKVSERKRNLDFILRDLDNDALKSDIQKFSKKYPVMAKKISPSLSKRVKIVSETIVAFHLFFLITGVSRGDRAVSLRLKIPTIKSGKKNFSDIFSRSVSLLGQRTLLKRVLQFVFIDKDLLKKTWVYYQKYYPEFQKKI